MAASSFLSLSLQPKPKTLRFSPSLSSIGRPRRRRTLSLSLSNPKPNSISIPRSSNPSSPSVDTEPAKPQIELEFVGPKAGADGSWPVDTASAISGEKLLRSIMIENKLELYAAYGKVMNCGGGGSCGTCIVEIIDGKDLLNERTDTEKRYLKKKPESWRLACQTIVGNKENTGKVVVQRLPQWKK